MCIDLEFYDTNDLLEFKNWLDDKKLHYDYYDEEREKYFINEDSIRVFDLNEYDNNYRSLQFYIEFFNDDDDELCYIDLNENKVANCKISLQ